MCVLFIVGLQATLADSKIRVTFIAGKETKGVGKTAQKFHSFRFRLRI